jgi:hypothetical protein
MTDWHAELFALIVEDDDTNQLCLISGEPLEPEHIKLSCNHAFNYIPFYNSTYSKHRKGTLNDDGIMKGAMTKLVVNKLECPYCRTIIPFIDLPSRGPKFVSIISKYAQCTATLKNGRQCKSKAIDGSNCCAKHGKMTIDKIIPSSSDDTHIYITQTDNITFSMSEDGNPVMIIEIPKSIATLKHGMSQLMIKK